MSPVEEPAVESTKEPAKESVKESLGNPQMTMFVGPYKLVPFETGTVVYREAIEIATFVEFDKAYRYAYLMCQWRRA